MDSHSEDELQNMDKNRSRDELIELRQLDRRKIQQLKTKIEKILAKENNSGTT